MNSQHQVTTLKERPSLPAGIPRRNRSIWHRPSRFVRGEVSKDLEVRREGLRRALRVVDGHGNSGAGRQRKAHGLGTFR